MVESELARHVFQSEDAKEGPKAFAEKRAPRGLFGTFQSSRSGSEPGAVQEVSPHAMLHRNPDEGATRCHA